VIANLFVSLLIGSVAFPSAAAPTPDSPFDQYGTISWEDEKARLDNFAIQLQNYERSIGYILVYDATQGCPGEAMARAIRAKRYLTEYRGIPWNRVVWRQEGYFKFVYTTLLIAPPNVHLPYPFKEPTIAPIDGPATRACKIKLRGIRKSRW
jgi:hypothetical protein